MRTLAILVLTVCLTGCAVGMKPHRRVFVNPERKEVRAKKIYDIAKECWSRRDYILIAGTVVENKVTLDGISIEARTASWFVGKKFMLIFVRDDPAGSKVEIFQPARGAPGLGPYWEDATRWALGNYSCA